MLSFKEKPEIQNILLQKVNNLILKSNWFFVFCFFFVCCFVLFLFFTNGCFSPVLQVMPCSGSVALPSSCLNKQEHIIEKQLLTSLWAEVIQNPLCYFCRCSAFHTFSTNKS